jgi:hypothetical protein
MAISRMQEPQQIQSGIGSLQDPRQGYFLGKLVKKATRGIKKIVKSPIGKLALLAGGAYGLGALGGAGQGGFLKQLMAGRSNFGLGNIMKGAGKLFLGSDGGVFGGGGGLLGKAGKFSGKRAFLTGGALASALPFFMGGDDEEEEVVDVMDPRYQVQRAKNYYSGEGDAGAGLDFMPQKKYVMQNFYAADGGRAGYANGMMVEEDDEEEFIRTGAGMSRRQPKTFLNMGGGAGQAQAEQMLMMEYVKYKNKGGDMSFEQFVKAVMQASQQPEGAGMEQPEAVMMAANGGPVPGSEVAGYTTPEGYNKFDYRSGGTPVRVGAQEGGIMETEEASEMIDMGGMEKDFRNEGGFVAMGGKERADDVPARLSKNEFVFTADAVRNAGGGDIDRGAEVMENLMNNLEQGGEVSEDSQGLEGAQRMYEQQQMLQSRMI